MESIEVIYGIRPINVGPESVFEIMGPKWRVSVLGLARAKHLKAHLVGHGSDIVAPAQEAVRPPDSAGFEVKPSVKAVLVAG